MTATCQIEVFNGTLIYTRAQLEQIKVNNTSANYKLMADIDLDPTLDNNNDGTPDGNWTHIGYDGGYFKGVLDGNGHTIRNMTINSTARNEGMFFSTSGGTIKNLKLENVNITTTNYYASPLVGKTCAGTTIENVAIVGGTITSNGYSAGIVCWGYNPGCTITNSYSTAKVVSTNGYDVAGLADGAVRLTNCYFAGEFANAISGRTGTVYARSNTSMSGCYYLNTCIKNKVTAQGTARTAEQFGDANNTDTNFPGWDFENTWIIKNGYPELRIFVKE